LLLAKTITTITLGADKIQRLTLKSALISPNSHKNPAWHSQQGVLASSPGKKAPGHFSFLSCPNKQKTEHQSESNPDTSWLP
jgi:hypothetical protein